MKHFSAAMLALGITLAAVPAAAFDATCTGLMFQTTVDGNLTVPTGASCQLGGVTVTGNVIVTKNKDVLRGQKLVVNLSTGVSRMDSGGGRVEGLFQSSPPKPDAQSRAAAPKTN